MEKSVTEKLIKLVGMMDSPHDGEALNAMRAAQRILKNHKTSLVEYVKFCAQQAEINSQRKPPQSQPASQQFHPAAQAQAQAQSSYTNFDDQLRRYQQAMNQRAQAKRSQWFGGLGGL